MMNSVFWNSVIEVASNLLLKMAMTDAQAADIAGVSVDFVKKVRRKLKK